MENATKALEMAGGVLIALLIISLFIYMFNEVSYNQSIQNQNIETKKLEAFNKKYESYNKTILYGADVISVINMAISNNILETNEGNQFNKNDPYYIDVCFTLIDDVNTKIIKVEQGKSVEEAKKAGDIFYEEDNEDYILLAKDGESVVEYRISDSDKKIQDKINLILPNDEGVVIDYNRRTGVTLVAIEAYEEFINRIFTCKEVKYHPTTGRVNEMVFEELKTTTETDDTDDF